MADGTDDGAAYAVAQSVRSTVGALTSANQQLGNVQGLLSTTQTGLNAISTPWPACAMCWSTCPDGSVTGTERSNYITTYQSLLANVKTDIQDANYNGKTLIGNMTGSNGTYSAMSVVRNENGAPYTVSSYSGATLYASIAYTSTQLNGAGTVRDSIGTATTASFINKMNSVDNGLNTVGAAVNYVNNQISYNSDKIDALNSGSARWWMPIWRRNRRSCKRCRSDSSWARRRCRWRTRRRRPC